MVFIETPVFTRLIRDLVNDEEYKAMQEALIVKPNAGALIRHSWWYPQITLEVGQ